MKEIARAANQATIEDAARCLRASGVVLLPTDTVFGLAGLPDHPAAIARIFELKARPAHKNLPVMVASHLQLEDIGAQLNKRTRMLMESPFCPGPLSIVVGLVEGKKPQWLMDRDEIAFRVPDDDFLLRLLASVGPLLVTSANRHGLATNGSVDDVQAQLSGIPDLVIDGRECGPTPSTLVNCRYSPPRIERVGAVSESQLAPYFES